jgi:hypothetical protein
MKPETLYKITGATAPAGGAGANNANAPDKSPRLSPANSCKRSKPRRPADKISETSGRQNKQRLTGQRRRSADKIELKAVKVPYPIEAKT